MFRINQTYALKAKQIFSTFLLLSYACDRYPNVFVFFDVWLIIKKSETRYNNMGEHDIHLSTRYHDILFYSNF
jgi:hypothetical protein